MALYPFAFNAIAPGGPVTPTAWLLTPACLTLAGQAPLLEALAKAKLSLEVRTRCEQVGNCTFEVPATGPLNRTFERSG